MWAVFGPKKIVSPVYDADEMTLVLSAASRDAVVMVADRRITDARTGHVYDELKNKLVVYQDKFVFGFTGLAHLDRQPVDEWLARGLRAHPNFETAVNAIAQRAAQILSQTPAGVPRHQAFVGVGWARVRGDSTRPIWICVSNAWDPSKDAWLSSPGSTFEVTARQIRPGKPWALFPPIGVSLKARETAKVCAMVRPALKRRTRGVAAAQLLAAGICEVAENRRTVGDAPTCVVLPRPKPTRGDGPRFYIPTASAAGIVPGPRAFEFKPPTGDVVWWPPILVEPGLMLVPKQVVRADGSKQFQYRAVPKAGTKPPAFAIGVTNGVKESALIVASDGGTEVVERELDEPWRTQP